MEILYSKLNSQSCLQRSSTPYHYSGGGWRSGRAPLSPPLLPEIKPIITRRTNQSVIALPESWASQKHRRYPADTESIAGIAALRGRIRQQMSCCTVVISNIGTGFIQEIDRHSMYNSLGKMLIEVADDESGGEPAHIVQVMAANQGRVQLRSQSQAGPQPGQPRVERSGRTHHPGPQQAILEADLIGAMQLRRSSLQPRTNRPCVRSIRRLHL